ncbi:MAG: peptidoglycan DD-metalloendopeptidase family protein [Nitrospirales bacterium]|nr:peptidoglycan DD-metalloendopeptidase family protein [Nitrospirales bacterium]
MRIVALAAVVALMAGAPALAAPDRSEPLPEKIRKERQTLEKLKDEIKEKKQKSDEAQRKEASVLQELEEADHRIKLRREDFVRVSEKLREKDREIAETNSSLHRLRERIAQREGSIRSRLRVMYKEGPNGQLKLLLASSGYNDLQARLASLRWISRREFQLLEGHRVDRVRLESTESHLLRVRGELQGYQQEIATKLAAVKDERTKKDRLLARVRSEKVMYVKAVEELEKSAQRIEGLIREFEARRKASASARTAPAGEGLARLKGRLGWPTEGDVVALFGRQKHPKFDTYVQRKGIEIRAGHGTVIRSVSDGVVAFADWMRGYGLLAIVDHGEGFFSLYAHASKLLVSVGDSVRGHQPIGEIGDTGLTGESTLYFELRQGGEALDPLAWLVRRR